MGHPLRWFIPHVVYEVTTRTIQERFLMRPSREARELILGVLGRAQTLYPDVKLHAFAYMSNHAQLLVSSSDGEQLVQFTGYVNGNVAREIGLIHDWRGHFWGRRNRPIPVLDDDALVDRLRYLLAQGVKEGLVTRPEDWPGATSTPALLGGSLRGRWVHRDLETRARRSPTTADPTRYVVHYDVELSPLPCWLRLSAAERVARVQALIDDVVTAAERSRAGRACLGVAGVLAAHPHDRPSAPARSPAPLCHAVSQAVRTAFRAMYRAFVDAFRQAVQLTKVQGQDALDAFPAGCFPPARGCVAYAPGAPLPTHELQGPAFAPYLARSRPKIGRVTRGGGE